MHSKRSGKVNHEPPEIYRTLSNNASIVDLRHNTSLAETALTLLYFGSVTCMVLTSCFLSFPGSCREKKNKKSE